MANSVRQNKSKRTPGIGLLAIVAIGACALAAPGAAPGPAPAPSPGGGPDMVAVFAANVNHDQAKEHALQTAAMLDMLATGLERDGRRSPPRLGTNGQVEDLRVSMREAMFSGQSLSTLYPAFGTTVEPFLNQVIGIDSGSLSPEQRVKWVGAFHVLAGRCRDAAGQL